jgi:hypothetical protein
VVADGIEVDGRWYHNGQIFQVGHAKTNELLDVPAWWLNDTPVF